MYRDRIQRGTAGAHAYYSSNKLGLFGLDLAAVACFFIEPWRRFAAEVPPFAQGWLLNEAAFSLRALNRLAEAREPMRAGMEMLVRQEDWDNAARAASTLSELELTLGDVPAAEATAAQSVTFADRSGNAFQRMSKRTAHADALHQAGRLEASRALFAEAETMQMERQPGYSLLYSLPGYQYCDLLLAAAERAAWPRGDGAQAARPRVLPAIAPGCLGGKLPPENAAETAALLSDFGAIARRVAQTLKWGTRHGGLLDIALDHLTLGRVHLLRAVFESPNAHLPSAKTSLDAALATLRQANRSDDLPRALLPCAWLHALLGEWDTARRRLDEAYALATRGGNPQNGWQGGMRLHLADTLLHRARLLGWRKEYPWPGRTPAADFNEVETLIDACGYHRRDQELADARAVLG